MPQPIDMPSELGRVTAAERVQQIADRLSLAAQQRHEEEAQADRVQHETQVDETEHARQEALNADEQQSQEQRPNKRRGGAEEGPKPRARQEAEDLEPHQLNVKI